MTDFLQRILNRFTQLQNIGKSAWISLLIILIVYALTALPQTDIIFITLVDHKPLSLVLFYVLLFFLINIVAHYPVYIEFKSQGATARDSTLTWSLEPKGWPIGFITYVEARKRSNFDSILRHLLGILLLAAVFFIMTTTYYNNIYSVTAGYESTFSGKGSFVIKWIPTLFFVVVSMAFFVGMPKVLGMRFSDIIKGASTADKKKLRWLFWSVLVVSIASMFWSVYCSSTTGWSGASFWAFYVSLYAVSFLYSALRLARRHLILTENVSFVKFLSLGGLFSLILVVTGHHQPFLFNPFVILIAYFIIFYGILILPLKHYLYYRQYDKADGREVGNIPPLSAIARVFYPIFSWGVPALPFVFFLYVGVIEFVLGNDLHTLKTVAMASPDTSRKQGAVGFPEFNNAMRKHFENKDTLYFIAAYGGGLKATIWSQLVLEKLASKEYGNILNKTVAMSGVSGGGIGLAVYTGFRHEQAPEKADSLIKTLNLKDFISLDINYFFGHDLFWGLMPQFLLDLFHVKEDRAKRAMREYGNVALMRDEYADDPAGIKDSTFQDYWAGYFRSETKKGRFYPALITNSAATHAQRGVAMSIRTTSKVLDSIFFDSTDLLNFDDKDSTSLPFLYAASTADRFPILSPPAKVEKKGYFLDGGYFENSGLMSLMDFSQHLREKVFPTFGEKWKKKKIFFIQIANDQPVYLRYLLQNQEVKKEIVNEQEFNSIVSAVVSIAFVASYLNKKFERDSSVKYVQVQLPYILKQGDLDGLYRGKVRSTEIQNLIKVNNKLVIDRMGKDPYVYVQPPLGRLMSRQSYEYMKMNLNYSELRELIGDTTRSAKLK